MDNMNIFQSLSQNLKLKRFLYWGIVVFLFLYIFSIPAFSGRPKWYVISYFLMSCLAGVTLAYMFLYSKFKLDKKMLIIPIFVLYSMVGTILYSHEYRGCLTLILMMVTLFVFYFAFSALNNYRFVLKIIIHAFLVFSLYFIFVYKSSFKNFNLSYLRLGTYFDNTNTIGFYFAIAFSLSFYLSLMFVKKKDLLYLLPSLLFAGLGYLTGSRAYLLVVAIGALVVLYSRFKKRKLIFLLSAFVAVGLFLILINIPTLSFLKDQFKRMFYTLFGVGDSKVDTSVVQRIIYPKYAWYLAGKNLVTGFGFNGFAIFSGVGTYSHNNYSEVICNFGIPGFIFYYLLFLIPFFSSFSSKEKDINVLYVIFAIYLVRNFFGVTYYTKDTYLVLAIMFYFTSDCRMPQFYTNYLKRKSLFCEVEV